MRPYRTYEDSFNTFRSLINLIYLSYNLKIQTQFSKSELWVGHLVLFDHYNAKSKEMTDKVKGTKHADG